MSEVSSGSFKDMLAQVSAMSPEELDKTAAGDVGPGAEEGEPSEDDTGELDDEEAEDGLDGDDSDEESEEEDEDDEGDAEEADSEEDSESDEDDEEEPEEPEAPSELEALKAELADMKQLLLQKEAPKDPEPEPRQQQRQHPGLHPEVQGALSELWNGGDPESIKEYPKAAQREATRIAKAIQADVLRHKLNPAAEYAERQQYFVEQQIQAALNKRLSGMEQRSNKAEANELLATYPELKDPAVEEGVFKEFKALPEALPLEQRLAIAVKSFKASETLAKQGTRKQKLDDKEAQQKRRRRSRKRGSSKANRGGKPKRVARSGNSREFLQNARDNPEGLPSLEELKDMLE